MECKNGKGKWIKLKILFYAFSQINRDLTCVNVRCLRRKGFVMDDDIKCPSCDSKDVQPDENFSSEDDGVILYRCLTCGEQWV